MHPKNVSYVIYYRRLRVLNISMVNTYQLDDLDQHPVVARFGQQFVQSWRQDEVVLGIRFGEFAEDVDGSANDGFIREVIIVSLKY